MISKVVLLKVVCGTTSPGDWLEMQRLRPYPSPTGSETLRVGSSQLCFNQCSSCLVSTVESGKQDAVTTSGSHASCAVWAPRAAVTPGASLLEVLERTGLWQEENSQVGERVQAPKSRPRRHLNPGALMQHLCVYLLLGSLSVIGPLPPPCLVTWANLFKCTGSHFPHL